MDDNSFFSIDRLVEFGLGMAMARQMINVMNESMQNMYIPGSANNIQQPQQNNIYVAINRQPIGPLSANDFLHLVNDKKATKDSLAWIPGLLNWKPIEQIPALLKIIALTPPSLPANI